MAEYIEREALMERLVKKKAESATHRYTEGFNAALMKFRSMVHCAPAADVAEVRHGEWIPDYETFVDLNGCETEPIQTGWVCSLCGRGEFQKEPYCNCGAKMDGKGEE